MRTLATDRYTADQVLAELEANTGRIGARFDVYPAGTLASTPVALETVTAATVELDVTRGIMGSLAVTMLPDATLAASGPFLPRIRPWLRIGMPDGGVAEYSMGVYVWPAAPGRRNHAVNQSEWQVTMGDLGHILLAGGPGLDGWTVSAGATVTTEVAKVLNAAGFSDASGIVASAKVTDAALAFDAGNAGSPTTWRKILDALTSPIGYQATWFDLDGVPRVQPQPDLSVASPSVTYRTSLESIPIVPDLEVANAMENVANRVIARASSSGGFTGAASVDLNDIIPGHPLSEAVIGFYIDVVIDNPVATSTGDLTTAAQVELLSRLGVWDTVTVPTLANPGHEAFDVIAVQWTGDVSLDSIQTYQERHWTMDLFDNGKMTHQGRRIT